TATDAAARARESVGETAFTYTLGVGRVSGDPEETTGEPGGITVGSDDDQRRGEGGRSVARDRLEGHERAFLRRRQDRGARARRRDRVALLPQPSRPKLRARTDEGHRLPRPGPRQSHLPGRAGEPEQGRLRGRLPRARGGLRGVPRR